MNVLFNVIHNDNEKFISIFVRIVIFNNIFYYSMYRAEIYRAYFGRRAFREINQNQPKNICIIIIYIESI